MALGPPVQGDVGFALLYQATPVTASTLFRCLFQEDPIYAFIIQKKEELCEWHPLCLSWGLLPRLELKHLAPWMATSDKLLQKEHQKPSRKRGRWRQRSSFLTRDRSLGTESAQYFQYRSFLRPRTCTALEIRGLSLLYFQLWLKTESKALRLWFPQSLCCMSYPNPSAFTKPSWCSSATFLDSSDSISPPLT